MLKSNKYEDRCHFLNYRPDSSSVMETSRVSQERLPKPNGQALAITNFLSKSFTIWRAFSHEFDADSCVAKVWLKLRARVTSIFANFSSNTLALCHRKNFQTMNFSSQAASIWTSSLANWKKSRLGSELYLRNHSSSIPCGLNVLVIPWVRKVGFVTPARFCWFVTTISLWIMATLTSWRTVVIVSCPMLGSACRFAKVSELSLMI